MWQNIVQQSTEGTWRSEDEINHRPK